jgi:hypothetical protein
MNDKTTSNNALFIHANIRNIFVTLDDTRYPNLDQNADFETNKFDAFYRGYVNGCAKLTDAEPIDCNLYKNCYPITFIDCSAQPAMLKGTGRNMSVTIQRNSNVPNNIDVYIIILEDRGIEMGCADPNVREI